ncbi:MAG: hypothetical protein ABJA78_00050 [Ferruginibacter sp.]
MSFLRTAVFFLLAGCSATQHLQKEISHQLSSRSYNKEINIDSLVTILKPLSSREREKIIVPFMLAGNIPSFNLQLKKVKIKFTDSTGKIYKAVVFVSPDYLCIGNDKQFMRMPLTPQAAQQIADSLHCILPTKKMVDEIYLAASVKSEPHPLTENRDSFQTFLQHHQIIEHQLNFKHSGKIIAGIKKDVVQTPKIYTASKPNRVAIYGWHQLTGIAIQPLYTGHVDWYVDYSHGIRLVYEKMIINKKVYLIKDVLNNRQLQPLLCDEDTCGYTRYKNN